MPQDPIHISLNGLIEDDKKLEMLWVKEGSFKLGYSEESESSNIVKVNLTHGFWMSRYPITVAQWYCGLDLHSELGTVEQSNRNLPKIVNRYEALMYCNELNRQFYTRHWEVGKQIIREGYRFNLPTESQWEYTCKAGAETRYYNGSDVENLNEIAWYSENSDQIQPVGGKRANNWGFHDMLGNVSEWCLDAFAPYPRGEKHDWVSVSNDVMVEYVTRGGNIEDNPYHLMCTTRGYQVPFTVVNIYGFRVCLSKPQI